MLEYGRKTKFEDTTFIDPKSIYKHTAAVSQYIDEWRRSLDTRTKVTFARAYVNLLDADVLHTYGESREALNALLDQHAREMNIGKTYKDSKVYERLLLHGDNSGSLRRRLGGEIRVRMRDQSFPSKVKWFLNALREGD
jgi:hypothetical protein